MRACLVRFSSRKENIQFQVTKPAGDCARSENFGHRKQNPAYIRKTQYSILSSQVLHPTNKLNMEGSNPSDGPVAPLLPRGGGDGPEKRPRTSSSGSSKVQPQPPQKKRSSARMDAMRKRSETVDSSALDSVPSLPRLASSAGKQQHRTGQMAAAAPTEMATLPLPSTFHQEPGFVRRLSVSLNTQVRIACECTKYHSG